MAKVTKDFPIIDCVSIYRTRKDLSTIHVWPAGIAQLGERQTEDLKVACSIHAHRMENLCSLHFMFF